MRIGYCLIVALFPSDVTIIDSKIVIAIFCNNRIVILSNYTKWNRNITTFSTVTRRFL